MWLTFLPVLLLAAGSAFSQTSGIIDAAMRDRVIEGAISKLNEFYVFPETARKMEDVLRARQRKGEYDAVTGGGLFAALLSKHLQEVSHDKHLSVNFVTADLANGERPPGSDSMQMRSKF